jgi:hypothetical protein
MVKNILLTIGIYLFFSCTSLRKADNLSASHVGDNLNVSNKADTIKKNRVLPYSEVITSKSVSDKGLFNIHKVNDKYFFEIPDSIFNRDILIVNRIIRSASGMRSADGMFGYGGDQISQKMVQFSKGPNNKIFIKELSYNDRAADTTENGMFWSVYKSNLHPLIASFDIKAISPDSARFVIDITDFINVDNNILFFNPYHKRQLSIGSFQGDKSYIEKVQSFPLNIEVRTFKTYQSTNTMQLFSYEINNSIVLLPKEPMRPRYEDPRVGYFGLAYSNFDANPQGIENTAIINRWRLEPISEDLEKYKKGELVEPKKPIVFYIDPATPKKWIPYFIQGVNDWQKAFEKAGFKNAIYALEAPTDDPEWSLEDARHNAIIYKASQVHNASGPHIHDPRTGEIIEAHINWYHNIMELLHDWYVVQAGAIDPRVRQAKFPDTLMGKLIRFAISHEVGHTLGLAHNMAASSTVPVENLRNKKWLERNGHTPSIMDYARFNYVAQPEDSVSEDGIFPRIGVYDEWAIEWGYKILPEFKSREDERVYMTKWITDKISKNPNLWYGFDFLRDPRMQVEDLSDDVMKADRYGIQNLKRIIPHIDEWTKEPGKGYNSARLLYEQIVNQYKRYLSHAANHIGAYNTTDKTVEEPGPVYEFCSLEKQRAAVKFLQDELFTTPLWIIDAKYFSLINQGSLFQILNLQDKMLKNVMSVSNLATLLKFQTTFPERAYTPVAFLNDLKSGLWNELKMKSAMIDIYSRNVQKLYIKQLVYLLSNPASGGKGDPMDVANYQLLISTDLYSIIKIHAKQLLSDINKALPNCKDEMTRAHLLESSRMLIGLINSEANQRDVKNMKENLFNTSTDVYDLDLLNELKLPKNNREYLDCWQH